MWVSLESTSALNNLLATVLVFFVLACFSIAYKFPFWCKVPAAHVWNPFWIYFLPTWILNGWNAPPRLPGLIHNASFFPSSFSKYNNNLHMNDDFNGNQPNCQPYIRNKKTSFLISMSTKHWQYTHPEILDEYLWFLRTHFCKSDKTIFSLSKKDLYSWLTEISNQPHTTLWTKKPLPHTQFVANLLTEVNTPQKIGIIAALSSVNISSFVYGKTVPRSNAHFVFAFVNNSRDNSQQTNKTNGSLLPQYLEGLFFKHMVALDNARDTLYFISNTPPWTIGIHPLCSFKRSRVVFPHIKKTPRWGRFTVRSVTSRKDHLSHLFVEWFHRLSESSALFISYHPEDWLKLIDIGQAWIFLCFSERECLGMLVFKNENCVSPPDFIEYTTTTEEHHVDLHSVHLVAAIDKKQTLLTHGTIQQPRETVREYSVGWTDWFVHAFHQLSRMKKDIRWGSFTYDSVGCTADIVDSVLIKSNANMRLVKSLPESLYLYGWNVAIFGGIPVPSQVCVLLV